MKWAISERALDSEFVLEVEERSGQNVNSCYQCGRCSAGCPVCYDMGYSPSQIIRLVQLGLREEVLSSDAIWMCASCQTCTIRCPAEVDLAKVMDSLRIIAHLEDSKKGAKAKGSIRELRKRSYPNLRVFSEIFLQSIREYGRLSEVALIMNYNINSGALFSNFLNAPTLFLKGKVKLRPGELKRIEKVRRIFDKIEELEGQEL